MEEFKFGGNIADNAEKVVRVVILTGFYKFRESEFEKAEISLDGKLSYSSYVYEFMKSTNPLPVRFQEFQDSCRAGGDETQKLFDGMKETRIDTVPGAA